MCSRTNKQNSGYNFYNSPSSQCNWVPPRDTKMNIINKTWHQQKSAADRFLCPAELLLLKSQISRESCNLCYSGLLEFRNSYVEEILCYLDFCWQGAKKMCILQQVDLRWNWSQRVKHCCTKSLGAMGLFWLLADCHSCLQFARKIQIYLQIYASPSLSSSKTAWHYTTRSRVCTPSVCLGNTFFPPSLWSVVAVGHQTLSGPLFQVIYQNHCTHA